MIIGIAMVYQHLSPYLRKIQVIAVSTDINV